MSLRGAVVPDLLAVVFFGADHVEVPVKTSPTAVNTTIRVTPMARSFPGRVASRLIRIKAAGR